MAFSKIVGFEVNPRSPSSSIIFFRVPWETSDRVIWSYHGLCPNLLNWAKGLLAIACLLGSFDVASCHFDRFPAASEFGFHGGNLSHPAQMSWFVTDAGGQEGPHQFQCQFYANDPRSQAEDVHLVVLHSLVRRISVMTKRGADAANLVGRYRGAHAAAADENSALGPPCHYLRRDIGGAVRVVVRRHGVVG